MKLVRCPGGMLNLRGINFGVEPEIQVPSNLSLGCQFRLVATRTDLGIKMEIKVTRPGEEWSVLVTTIRKKLPPAVIGSDSYPKKDEPTYQLAHHVFACCQNWQFSKEGKKGLRVNVVCFGSQGADINLE